jgi:CARDB
MIRWGRIIGVSAAVFFLLAPGAHAASSVARAALTSCDREAHSAVFEARMITVKRAAKMQLRFTLQVSTPEAPKWRKVPAAGFDQWLTVPAGISKYTYDKTVEELVTPANYRTVITFRWRDARGRSIRSETATSPVCRQPDQRPDLVIRELRAQAKGYVALVANRGRTAAGTFGVDFLRAGEPLGSETVPGLAPGEVTTVVIQAMPCSPGEQISAVVDPRSEVDEADEENDTAALVC